jgi:hypothetical protein
MKEKVVVSAEGNEAVAEDNFPAAIVRAHKLGKKNARHAKAAPSLAGRDKTRPPYWTWFIANPRGHDET